MKKTILLLGISVFGIGACSTTPDTASIPASTSETIQSVEMQPPQTPKASKLKSVEIIQPSASSIGDHDKGTERTIVPKQVALESQSPVSHFEPLVYGAEKDLVCTTPVLAEGNLKNRPNMQIMWENYLYDRPEGIWGEIGGLVEVNGNLPFDQGRWTNACAVRISHMLNKAGHKIPRENGNKTVSGGNKDQYYYRLKDLENYLISKYGQPDLNISDGTANSFDLPITPGIVLMDFPDNSFTGHVTVWNGGGTVDGFEIGGYRVLFWDLPCFIPEDRQKPIVTQAESTNVKPASP